MISDLLNKKCKTFSVSIFSFMKIDGQIIFVVNFEGLLFFLEKGFKRDLAVYLCHLKRQLSFLTDRL